MKFRACIIAITLTAMLFIPMSAAFTNLDLQSEKDIGNTDSSSLGQEGSKPDSSGQSSEASSQVTDNVSSFTDEYFRIYDLTEKVVKNVGYEDYVRGAIAAEMGAGFEFEALVAQGTAALSCGLYQKNAHSTADYDFTADPANKLIYITEEQAKEVYGDAFEESWEKICEAAKEAMKMVVIYNGAPAMTVYHAISAGRTESAENVWGGAIDYLVPVESEGDELHSDFETTVSVSKAQALETLNSYGAGLNGEFPEQWFEGAELSDSGYVNKIQIGAATFPGTKIRSLFGLRSSAFTVEYKDGEFVFTVRGYGHGVGMSQVGANYMAKNGATAEEILEHYYPGTTIAPCT